ncbi:MAG: hypothetical protein JO033_14725, partial [Acidobacteriaceae bacterium]|nr:hypothetical protein [Acidobacteriaceae bacterium]
MLIAFVVFLVIFTIVMGCVGLGLYYFKSKQRQQIRSMLRRAEETPAERRAELVRPAQVQDQLTKILGRFKFMGNLDLVLKQAGKNSSASKLLMLSCITGGIGLVAGSRIPLGAPEVTACVGALGGLSIPLLLVLHKRRKTFAAFEKELPEALDFLARS